MFETQNKVLLNRQAIDLIIKNLPGAVSMDDIEGKSKPYDVNWNGLKLLVNVGRLSKKKAFARPRWYFALRERDHLIADFIILVCLHEDRIAAIYTLPQAFSPKSFITISKLDANMRYDYFRTDIERIGQKIVEVKNNLPKLMKISNEAEGMKNG
jgi:hypothetical protein